ncbi:hypothetical protein [Paraburkholderia azotifigens]|uniref:hypothetical protein n=1 Tax=Paraburkholderia azotifigens TaxID=2057004 RepID=UPI0038B9F3E3
MSSSKLPRLIGSALGFLFYQSAMAGIISLYDESRIITFSNGHKTYGHYAAHNELFYCEFFFMSDGPVHDSDKTIPIQTFDLNYRKNKYTYSRRESDSSIQGALTKQGSAITITTENPRGGCQSAAGLFSDGGVPYTEVKRIAGLGFGVATRKTVIYINPDEIKKRGYLLAGDTVAVIKQKNNYSYVRYVNPDMLIEDDDKRHITTGWVRSTDLVDPFPPAGKQ